MKVKVKLVQACIFYVTLSYLSLLIYSFAESLSAPIFLPILFPYMSSPHLVPTLPTPYSSPCPHPGPSSLHPSLSLPALILHSWQLLFVQSLSQLWYNTNLQVHVLCRAKSQWPLNRRLTDADKSTPQSHTGKSLIPECQSHSWIKLKHSLGAESIRWWCLLKLDVVWNRYSSNLS